MVVFKPVLQKELELCLTILYLIIKKIFGWPIKGKHLISFFNKTKRQKANLAQPINIDTERVAQP